MGKCLQISEGFLKSYFIKKKYVKEKLKYLQQYDNAYSGEEIQSHQMLLCNLLFIKLQYIPYVSTYAYIYLYKYIYTYKTYAYTVRIYKYMYIAEYCSGNE